MKAAFLSRKSVFPLQRRYQLLLVIAVILTVYYPAIFGELCRVDDREMVDSLQNQQSWSLKSIFIPGTHDGVYYRPILSLSFLFDKYVWKLVPGMMHLENILLHVMNALLVYWLAFQLLPVAKKSASLIPLVAALFFGLHPVNAESVNWISARTDVLAAFFILLSANFLLLFMEYRSHRFLLLFLLFMVMGFLTKEVAIAFLAGAFLLITARNRFGAEISPAPARSSLPKHLSSLLVLTGAVAVFFLFRSFAIVSNEGRIGFTLQVLFSDIVHATFLFLQAFAFYLKKLIFPFPLNFAIVEIDPLYELLAVPLVLFCMYLVSKRTVLSATFLAGVFLITPAFLIALGQIAWTPYAERYLYLPSAFLLVALISYSGVLLEKISSLYARKQVFVMVLLAVMAVATFHRSIVWTKNVTLFESTVKHSPTSYAARSEYAFALTRQGDFQNARTQFAIAKTLQKTSMPFTISTQFYNNRLGYWQDADLGLAYLLEKEGKIPAAAAAYEDVYQRSNGRSVTALVRLVMLYGDLFFIENNAGRAVALKKKVSIYAKKLYTIKSPHVLYRTGKILMVRGDRQGALACFKKAQEKFPVDHEYRLFTEKLIERLERQ